MRCCSFVALLLACTNNVQPPDGFANGCGDDPDTCPSGLTCFVVWTDIDGGCYDEEGIGTCSIACGSDADCTKALGNGVSCVGAGCKGGSFCMPSSD